MDMLEFSFAGDGEEALNILENGRDVEVVLSDIRMPRMDGLTLLENIRDLDRTLKVVIVSAFGDMDNIRIAMNRGAFDFITKPIDFDDLSTTIKKTFDEVHELRRAIRLQQKMSAIELELELASQIQLSVLPSSFPAFPDRGEVDLYATMIPAREVGGDFYDFFWIDDDHLGFVIGDVSGKGVGAAMFMTIARTLIRATALEKHHVKDVLCRVNRALYIETMRHMFVTAVYGVLDTRSGKIEASNAGHHAPIRLSKGGAEALERKGGPILCALPEFEYGYSTTELAAGESIFLYTDGITEARNVEGEEFGDERLHDTLLEVAGQPPAEVLRHALRTVQSYSGSHQQSDDITMLGLRFNG